MHMETKCLLKILSTMYIDFVQVTPSSDGFSYWGKKVNSSKNYNTKNKEFSRGLKEFM